MQIDSDRSIPNLPSIGIELHTTKLALPSVSQIQARASDDGQWYQHTGQYPVSAGAQHQASSSSVGSSPRAGSFSASSIANQSYDSNTTYASPAEQTKPTGLQTPSPDQPPTHHSHPYSASGYSYSQQPYGSMNQAQPYMDVNQAHAPAAAPAPGYTTYGQPQPLQPASQQYQPSSGYGQYSNPYSMAPMSAGHQAQPR